MSHDSAHFSESFKVAGDTWLEEACGCCNGQARFGAAGLRLGLRGSLLGASLGQGPVSLGSMEGSCRGSPRKLPSWDLRHFIKLPHGYAPGTCAHPAAIKWDQGRIYNQGCKVITAKRLFRWVQVEVRVPKFKTSRHFLAAEDLPGWWTSSEVPMAEASPRVNEGAPLSMVLSSDSRTPVGWGHPGWDATFWGLTCMPPTDCVFSGFAPL